ncbi:hypothetical protein WJX72_000574 [[Myrmecia] bisecta]|uniref:OTU domain-containing protein n=1 Tax=[Myrmecia] bisecta TaxID=41462 RepID=A0AAW1PPL6_9CHLO
MTTTADQHKAAVAPGQSCAMFLQHVQQHLMKFGVTQRSASLAARVLGSSTHSTVEDATVGGAVSASVDAGGVRSVAQCHAHIEARSKSGDTVADAAPTQAARHRAAYHDHGRRREARIAAPRINRQNTANRLAARRWVRHAQVQPAQPSHTTILAAAPQPHIISLTDGLADAVRGTSADHPHAFQRQLNVAAQYMLQRLAQCSACDSPQAAGTPKACIIVRCRRRHSQQALTEPTAASALPLATPAPAGIASRSAASAPALQSQPRRLSACVGGGPTPSGNHPPNSPPAGFHPFPIKGDGSCLFRAILSAVGGDEEQHLQLRQRVVRFLAARWDSRVNAARPRTSDSVDQGITWGVQITEAHARRSGWTAKAYERCMLRQPAAGHMWMYGTAVEAYAASVLLDRRVVILDRSGQILNSPLMNESPGVTPIHILFDAAAQHFSCLQPQMPDPQPAQQVPAAVPARRATVAAQDEGVEGGEDEQEAGPCVDDARGECGGHCTDDCNARKRQRLANTEGMGPSTSGGGGVGDRVMARDGEAEMEEEEAEMEEAAEMETETELEEETDTEETDLEDTDMEEEDAAAPAWRSTQTPVTCNLNQVQSQPQASQATSAYGQAASTSYGGSSGYGMQQGAAATGYGAAPVAQSGYGSGAGAPHNGYGHASSGTQQTAAQSDHGAQTGCGATTTAATGTACGNGSQQAGYGNRADATGAAASGCNIGGAGYGGTAPIQAAAGTGRGGQGAAASRTGSITQAAGVGSYGAQAASTGGSGATRPAYGTGAAATGGASQCGACQQKPAAALQCISAAATGSSADCGQAAQAGHGQAAMGCGQGQASGYGRQQDGVGPDSIDPAAGKPGGRRPECIGCKYAPNPKGGCRPDERRRQGVARHGDSPDAANGNAPVPPRSKCGYMANKRWPRRCERCINCSHSPQGPCCTWSPAHIAHWSKSWHRPTSPTGTKANHQAALRKPGIAEAVLQLLSGFIERVKRECRQVEGGVYKIEDILTKLQDALTKIDIDLWHAFNSERNAKRIADMPVHRDVIFIVGNCPVGSNLFLDNERTPDGKKGVYFSRSGEVVVRWAKRGGFLDRLVTSDVQWCGPEHCPDSAHWACCPNIAFDCHEVHAAMLGVQMDALRLSGRPPAHLILAGCVAARFGCPGWNTTHLQSHPAGSGGGGTIRRINFMVHPCVGFYLDEYHTAQMKGRRLRACEAASNFLMLLHVIHTDLLDRGEALDDDPWRDPYTQEYMPPQDEHDLHDFWMSPAYLAGRNARWPRTKCPVDGCKEFVSGAHPSACKQHKKAQAVEVDGERIKWCNGCKELCDVAQFGGSKQNLCMACRTGESPCLVEGCLESGMRGAAFRVVSSFLEEPPGTHRCRSCLYRMCAIAGCETRASFGTPDSHPVLCAWHAEGLDDYVNLPNLGSPGDKAPPGQVRRHTRFCAHQGCRKRPSYGSPGKVKLSFTFVPYTT